MNMESWRKCADPTLSLEEFEGQECVVAFDLASKIDIAARMQLFWKEVQGKRHYWAFGRYYLPEEKISEIDQYQGWVINK